MSLGRGGELLDISNDSLFLTQINPYQECSDCQGSDNDQADQKTTFAAETSVYIHHGIRLCYHASSLLGMEKQAILRRSVVFPHPDGPTRKNNSPSAISSDTTFTAVMASTCPAKPSRSGTCPAKPSRSGTCPAKPSRSGTCPAKPSRSGTCPA